MNSGRHIAQGRRFVGVERNAVFVAVHSDLRGSGGPCPGALDRRGRRCRCVIVGQLARSFDVSNRRLWRTRVLAEDRGDRLVFRRVGDRVQTISQDSRRFSR